MNKILDNQVALITGASRGIGYALAKAVAFAGAHVIAVARTTGGLEELDDEIQSSGGSSTLVPLDLTDMPALDRLGASIFERWGKIDILVGNAAQLGTLSPLTHVSPETWSQVIDLNLTVNWRLIRAFDPLLRASENPHALFLTSDMAHICKPYWGPFSVSKAALSALVQTYAKESKLTNIKVNLVDPGPTRTALRAKAMPGEEKDLLRTPENVASHLLQLLEPSCTDTGCTFALRGNRLEKDSSL